MQFAFATAGFTQDLNFSPNNQQFTAAVLAACARAGLPFGFEAANTVLAGPASGARALPTYRTLVAADIPGGINGFANPTGLIGLSAVNGTATTADRSDSTHAIDQSIVPTWTGAHTFTPASSVVAVTINAAATKIGLVVNGAGGSNLYAAQINGSTAASSRGLLVLGGVAGSSDHGLTINDAASTVNVFIVRQNPAILALGPVAAALIDMTPDQGTFTGTITGCTTSPTGTCRWVRIGQLVMLFIPIITGTSNATTFTMTGLPAAIQPARTMMFPVGDLENASVFTGTFAGQVAAASGTVTFFFNGSSSGFTNTGTKGFSSEQVVCWTLN